jgi:hypothetical protein
MDPRVLYSSRCMQDEVVGADDNKADDEQNKRIKGRPTDGVERRRRGAEEQEGLHH